MMKKAVIKVLRVCFHLLIGRFSVRGKNFPRYILPRWFYILHLNLSMESAKMVFSMVVHNPWSFGQGHLVIFIFGCVIWLTIYK